MSAPNVSPASAAFFIADHAALDFLNSVAGSGAERMEFFADDAHVLEWLQRAGVPVSGAAAILKRHRPGILRDTAVALREETRDLIARRKAGRHGQPVLLNRILERNVSYRQLVWKPGSTPRRMTFERLEKPEDLLAPIAEAVAELLENGDYALVRKCENPACTLWFYDRANSRMRRWCSMAICGNRMKVAAFRARRAKQARRTAAAR